MTFVLVILWFICWSYVLGSDIPYGEACNEGNECQTKICHPLSKTCDCFQLREYSSIGEGRRIDQIIINGVCMSRVHQVCTLPNANDDGLMFINCIPGALCKTSRLVKGSKNLFGLCECLPSFEPSVNFKQCTDTKQFANAKRATSLILTTPTYVILPRLTKQSRILTTLRDTPLLLPSEPTFWDIRKKANNITKNCSNKTRITFFSLTAAVGFAFVFVSLN